MDEHSSTRVAGMVGRIKDLITKPAATWPGIAAEPTTPGDLITRYALPLAAIGPVCTFIHGQLYGYGALGFSYKPGVSAGLTTLIVSYVLGLVGVIVLGLVADFVAPKFGGEANRANAFKLVVYGSTAAWIVGVFQLIPGLGILGLLGLYSLYLIYTGATPVMKVPQDKAGGFTAVTILAAVLLNIAAGGLTTSVVALFGGGMVGSMTTDEDAEITLPGGGKLDTGRLEEATKQMEAAARGEKVAVQPGALQGLLPASVGGYQRNAVEATAMGGMGSQAQGTYAAGDRSFTLKVVDMAGLGAVAGLGAAMGVEQSREDANGYERTTTVDGQMQVEAWDKTGNNGKFGRMVASRFMIEAEGEAASIDDLKAAVAAVDAGKLAGLAK